MQCIIIACLVVNEEDNTAVLPFRPSPLPMTYCTSRCPSSSFISRQQIQISLIYVDLTGSLSLSFLPFIPSYQKQYENEPTFFPKKYSRYWRRHRRCIDRVLSFDPPTEVAKHYDYHRGRHQNRCGGQWLQWRIPCQRLAWFFDCQLE